MMKARILCFAAQLFLFVGLPTGLLAQTDNPTGPTGIYNGNITTAGNYDPWTGNQMRIVDDIVVPGSVGAYPLKWTRYYNTNNNPQANGGQWSFSYQDYHVQSYAYKVPDGRQLPTTPINSKGISDYGAGVTQGNSIYHTIHFSDGGKVNFAPKPVTSPVDPPPTELVDPYGQVTKMTYTTQGHYPPPNAYVPIQVLDRVTEPGGRYLQLTWQNSPASGYFPLVISKVEAFDGPNGNSLGSVNYFWIASPQEHGQWPLLDHVTYADGTTAHYTYDTESIGLGNGLHLNFPNLFTSDDVRYDGPMRQIAYGIYDSTGQLVPARDCESNFNTHEGLSKAYFISNDRQNFPDGSGTMTQIVYGETRGDGATSTFAYDETCTWGPHPGRTESFDCGDNAGKLKAYTDFLGHTTKIGFDSGTGTASYGYINSVTDPNGLITTYTRATPQDNTWNVTRVDYPDGSFITQTYTDDANPYYLASRTDELGRTTIYTRDGNNRITRKDYSDGSYETFAYNPFGQVLTHRMNNGAYQHFSYDGRGLLLAKTNPTWNSDHDGSLASDPQTTYSYYTSGAWTDRVSQATDPRGLATQFEYDHTFDSSGNETTTPAGGRGRVTKTTHSDGTYQSFGYNKYGDKLWEENELRKRTNYTYDEYGRVTAVSDPYQHTTTHDYTKPGQTTSTVTTFNQPFTTVLPMGETTKTTYDDNWRKSTVQTLDGSSSPPTTSFIYDSYNGYTSIGNLVATQDPRGNVTKYTYDSRNRKLTATDPLGLTTTYHYDAVGNVFAIDRPDGTTESKTYDSMNRVLTDTVPKAGTAATVTESVTTTFEYYPGNASQMGGQLWHLTDGKGQTTTFEYDPSGMKTKMTYPNNADYQGWTYDPDHNLIARQTVNGVSQLFSYDSRNRQTSMAWSNGLDWASFGYDAASRMTKAQNPTSIVTRAYDDANHLTHDQQQLQIMAIRAVSRKAHGSAGTFDIALPLTGTPGIECRPGQGANSDQHQIVVTFPRAVTVGGATVTPGTGGTATLSGPPVATGNIVTINLSSVSNAQTLIVTLSNVSDGSVTNDVLVGMGVLLGDTTGNGVVNSSDVADVQSQSGQAVTSSNFREDVTLNGLINSSDITTVQSHSGTALGNQLSITQPTPSSPTIDVQYSYDNDGKNTRMFVSSAGYDLTYTYDPMGRFQGISKTAGNQLFQYAYDAASNETHRTNIANGLDQVYTIDPLINRMTSRTVSSSSGAISVEAYGYDPSRPGLLTSVTHKEGQQAPTHDAFGYDLLPELMSAQYNLAGAAAGTAIGLLNQLPPVAGGGGLVTPTPPNPPARNSSYTWDKAGNRMSMNDSASGSYTYATNNLNQYWSDGTGFMTNGSEHELSNYQNVTYGYINDTHLSLVSGTDVLGQQSKYEMYYDALGRCAVRTLNGSTTYYIYDGEKAILEYRGWSNGPSAANLYGKSIDEILMRTDYTRTSNQTFYYQDDHEGSVTHLTDGSGNVLEYYRYDAFGKPTIYNSTGQNATAFGNRFMFTGREYVATFGIYEYRNRAYHPGLGRFMSEDPKGFDAGDNNFFRYVGNDPLDRTDPMGLADRDETAQPTENAGDQNTSTNPDTAKEVIVPGTDVGAGAVDTFRNGPGGTQALKTVQGLYGVPNADYVHNQIDSQAAKEPEPRILTKQEIREIEHGDPSDTEPLFSPLDLLTTFAAKIAAGGSKMVISAGSHALRHLPDAARSEVAQAIAKDLAQKGAPAIGRDIQRVINVGGRQIEYRAHGLPNGTTKVSTVVGGRFSRDITVPSTQ